jgi:hypothetical protein
VSILDYWIYITIMKINGYMDNRRICTYVIKGSVGDNSASYSKTLFHLLRIPREENGRKDKRGEERRREEERRGEGRGEERREEKRREEVL